MEIHTFSKISAYNEKLPTLLTRLGSNLLDYALITFTSNLISRIISFSSNTPYFWNETTPSSTIQLSQFIYLLIAVVYGIYFLVNKGATFGKIAVHLKVIDIKTQQNVTYKKALLREIIKNGLYVLSIFNIALIGIIYLLINVLVIVFSKDRRGIHDRIANTIVIYDN